MKVTPGATDVTTYFALRLAADGTEATGLTITNFDLQYVRTRTAPVAKVDATALAATDSAHGDNQAIEIDPTDQPGLYRVDWPDAAFAAGVAEVILTVKCATAFTEHLRVSLETVQTGDSFARIGVNGAGLTAIDLPNQTMDITGNITGNLSGSVGSVTGAVGSVTGAVGSVTGAVGSVTDVSNIVTGAITVSGGIASADIKKVNNVTVNGDGSGTPWGP